MKQQRDLELIKKLLLDLEGVEAVDLSGYADDKLKYHKYLLINANLAEGLNIDDRKGNIVDAVLWWLTWEGQEFLANARNDRAWQEVTGEIAAKGLDVSFSVLKSLLAAYMMQQFGLS